MILLDTHTLLWWILDPPSLSKNVLELIEKEFKQANLEFDPSNFIVEKVQKKREKREQNKISNKLAVQLNDYQLKTIVNNLDNMIKEQEKNIKKIKNPTNSQENNPITILID
jgi:PIN domain nuclease of toxin-antitoxin system